MILRHQLRVIGGVALLVLLAGTAHAGICVPGDEASCLDNGAESQDVGIGGLNNVEANPYTTAAPDNGGGAGGGTENISGGNNTSLGLNKSDKVNLNNTMNFGDCHQFNVGKSMKICVLIGFGSFQCSKMPPLRCVPSYDYTFTYWEPSELIEVSCRKGYSMLLPGGVGEIPEKQSCTSAGSGMSKRWFFDARVWAINGKDGAARQQAAGSKKRDQSVACGANGPFGGLDQLEGYAKKFKMFKQGAASGPGQSWQAYISDYDASWAKDAGPDTASRPVPTQTKCTGTSVENCWGPVQSLMGWVSHPQQPVAAALAGWRAHTKAAGKVSPALNGGYKINLDYPYIMRTSPFGQSMGLQGASSSGGAGAGNQGSRCFQPGDPGPWWYTNNQRQDTKPEQLPGVIQQLKAGDAGLGAAMTSGVYIFTYWVKTSCELFAGIDGTNVQAAISGCKDKQKY